MTKCKYYKDCGEYEHEATLCCFFYRFCSEYQFQEGQKAIERIELNQKRQIKSSLEMALQNNK